MKNKRRAFKGFTLVELLIVIGIISLLATLSLIGYNYAKSKAKITKAEHDIAKIHHAIEMLANDTVVWPGHQEINKVNSTSNNEICSDGCAYGITDAQAGIVDNDGNYLHWTGPYMQIIPDDPWGNEYFFDTDYDVDGNTVAAVGSYGPNKVGNNQYDDDDVIKIIAE